MGLKEGSKYKDFNITILCCHTFNWKCLVGWGGNNKNFQEEIEDGDNMIDDD